jgi:hypothetical protein
MLGTKQPVYDGILFLDSRRTRMKIRQGKGGEALELVNVAKERATFGGRRICPAESGKSEGCHE